MRQIGYGTYSGEEIRAMRAELARDGIENESDASRQNRAMAILEHRNLTQSRGTGIRQSPTDTVEASAF